MHLKNRDILLAFGVVVLNVVWMLLPYHIWEVGTLLALPLVFFVPGYMLIENPGPQAWIEYIISYHVKPRPQPCPRYSVWLLAQCVANRVTFTVMGHSAQLFDAGLCTRRSLPEKIRYTDKRRP